MSERPSPSTWTGGDWYPRSAITSPESPTILRITYGWVRMPDAIVRYALASSSNFTSEAPKAVVAYGRKGVFIPRLRSTHSPRPLEQRRTSGGGAEFHDATRGVRKPL